MLKKRNIITVPIDKDAERALAFDEATSKQLIELELIEKEYYQLWRYGIFDLINKIADSNIDDFEDANITDKQAIINVINELENQEGTNVKVKKLKDLFQIALDKGTGVYFYF